LLTINGVSDGGGVTSVVCV